MDAIEAIRTRRSIRKYVKKPVSKEQIKELIKIGMSAPSAGDEQPWHFIVIDDSNILKEIPSFHNHAQMLKDAAVAILVCGDLNLEKHKGMWVQDCSAATQNILIAVNAIGLGAVWLGVYPRKERVSSLRKLLNIPNNIVPFSLISIGYPAEEKKPSNRYSESRVHLNKW
jgi:nitroreductase